MLKKTVFGFACVVAILLVSTAPAQSWGGPVSNNLKQTFCSSVSPAPKKTGCKGYFDLRIIHGMGRDKTLSTCRNGSNSCPRYYSGSELTQCREGCSYANSLDK